MAFSQVDYLISNPPYVDKEATTGKKKGSGMNQKSFIFKR